MLHTGILHRFYFGDESKLNVNYRIGVIGDLHGKDVWKKIFDSRPNVDKWIFIGDYVDSFTIDNHQMIENLNEIIYMKKTLGDKIELLLGNHDMQYMFYPNYRCSGFRAELAETLRIIFQDEKRLFKIAHYEAGHLFTHAGISKPFMKQLLIGNPDRKNPAVLAEDLNMAIDSSNLRNMIMEVGVDRGGCMSCHGGPLWADKFETRLNSGTPGTNQVVGHSRVKKLECFYDEPNTLMTYCDTLDHNKHIEFLTISFHKSGNTIIPIRQVSNCIPME